MEVIFILMSPRSRLRLFVAMMGKFQAQTQLSTKVNTIELCKVEKIMNELDRIRKTLI